MLKFSIVAWRKMNCVGTSTTFTIRLLVQASMILILILKLAEYVEAGNVIVHNHRNKVLVGHGYRNISLVGRRKCLEYCLADCLCLSYQTCANERCQLYNSSYLNPTSLQYSEDCDYNDFEYQGGTELSTGQCGQGCLTNINCCLMSSPCYHGGTCLPSMSRDGQRFTCKCPDDYEGERCEKKLCKPGYKGKDCQDRIRSCQGYKDGSLRPGNYTIIDDADKPYQVFCIFVKGNNFAWTLIQSYSLENKDKFNKSLIVDHPVNENRPSWLEYRLSKARMDFIRQFFNTHWRITCNFKSEKWTMKDFVRGRFKHAPLFNASEGCLKLEYINIRGRYCSGQQCQAFLVNDGIRPFYFDPKRSGQNCSLHVQDIIMCGSEGENSFGYYQCINPTHRCSSSPNSTTQLWFGGR